ncbi:MAG: TM2 domain-containing protein [Clostridiales bacterium]|jgi:TM2 domain-containing membrane protein YozV|nr:TM2 domain-containing protein [Clostridiales bacterium]
MKSKTTALLLSIFLGGLGVDRFYVGKVGTGVLKLLTGAGLGIWWLVDIILIATGNFKDKQGNPLQ